MPCVLFLSIMLLGATARAEQVNCESSQDGHCSDPDEVSFLQAKQALMQLKPKADDCARGTMGYRTGDCVLNSASDRTGCDGKFYNLDLHVKPTTWTYYQHGCVLKNNLVRYTKSQVETLGACQQKCEDNDQCKSIEFGVAYGGDGKGCSDESCSTRVNPYAVGDCVLNSASDRTGCDGKKYNLDLYVKPTKPTWTYYNQGCVEKNNLEWFNKSQVKTLGACQQKCDDNDQCKSIEFGVAYGGLGKGCSDKICSTRDKPYAVGDCMLNSAADTTGCNGTFYNLDLYVKPTKPTWTTYKKGCVIGMNLEWNTNNKYDLDQCKKRCEDNDQCESIEFGVAYGGAGKGTFQKGACDAVKKSSGASCFPGNAKVVSRSGPKNMDQVRLGDELLGFNHATGIVEFTKVRAWLHRTTDATISMTKLHTDVGDIVASPMHSLAVGTAPDMYAFAKDIPAGHALITPNGPVTVRTSSSENGKGLYAPLTWTSNFFVSMGEGTAEGATSTFLAHSFSGWPSPRHVEAPMHSLLSFAEFFSRSVHEVDDGTETDYVHPVCRLLAWIAGIIPSRSSISV